jgi:hypothetical protein
VLAQEEGEAPWRARAANPFRGGEFRGLENRTYSVRPAMVTTKQLLREAAEAVLKESCGEGFLLQPKIEDFDKLEYRCVPPVQQE